MMRIALGGIAVECCTFSPILTELSDFRVARGDDLLILYPFVRRYTDVEAIPLVRARALPGGIVRRSAYESLKREFLERLRAAGTIDGVYLDMHGAMAVQGLQDAELDWIRAVREVVGERCLIAASYDLHGNVTHALGNQLNILSAYRTAPHVDVEETRQRACDLLVACVQAEIRPHVHVVPIPLLLAGEQATTDRDPTAFLYDMVRDYASNDSLLDASLLVGYAWADEPRSGASVVAVGLDHSMTAQAANGLANAVWQARRAFDFGMPTGDVEACIHAAMQADRTPFFISDAGDNVTGGAVGDVPHILEQLLRCDLKNALFASIVDPSAVDICFVMGVGCEVLLSLGGKLDTLNGSPLQVVAMIQTLHVTPSGERQVVIDVNGITVILTEIRTAFTELNQFHALGVHPTTFSVVVVKLGYLFPELQTIAAQSMLAFSHGALNPRLEALRYRWVRRPMFPLNAHMEWHPEIQAQTMR
jgi:microcystin degradation protein MlrC